MIRLKIVLIVLVAPVLMLSCTEQEKPLNFIVFLVDDMGWTDLGCYGSDLYETPNIDQLAAEGVTFTQGYAACTVCSPTRAAIMTGKYPARINLTDWISGHKRPHAKLKVPEWQMYLDTAEQTLAERLRVLGYVTANVGKWHLGDAPTYWPENQGFDLNVGGYRWGAPGSYFYPYHGNRRDNMHPPNLEEGIEGEYLTYRLTTEAGKFIRENKDKPFFLYFPHYAVHTPLQAPDSLVQYYRNKVRPGLKHDNPTYAAMVHSVDQSVGTILDLLLESGLSGRTVVFFTSDNGGLTLRDITDNKPLRAGKGSPYEGGVRVPFIVVHPSMTNRGKTCAVPVITMDIWTSILRMAGAPEAESDGLDISPLLSDPSAEMPERALYWHYPHYHPGGATPYSAMRRGRYRLVEFFEDGRLELYDLVEDIGEKNNLAEVKSRIARDMYSELVRWRHAVEAQLPEKNPDFVPEQ